MFGKHHTPLAFEMLTEAAVSRRLTREALEALQKYHTFPDRNAAEVQMEVLQVLQHDGYLKPKGNGFVFESQLLRAWWKNRYRFHFVPVLKRGKQ